MGQEEAQESVISLRFNDESVREVCISQDPSGHSIERSQSKYLSSMKLLTPGNKRVKIVL